MERIDGEGCKLRVQNSIRELALADLQTITCNTLLI